MPVVHDELLLGTFTTTVEFVLPGAGSAARKSVRLALLAWQFAIVQEPVCADVTKGKSSAKNRSRFLAVLA
jgi:hypothetical protein